MIPSVEQMNNPQILLEVKRKNSVVRKCLLDVLGDKLRTNISSPIKKKKELPKFVSPSASDVTPTSQNESPVQAVQNQVQRCIAETLNLELVSIWNSKTVRNLFGMKLGDDVKEKVKQIGTALKYAVNNFEYLMQLMPDGCTESEVRDQIGEHELEHLKKKCHYLGTAWNLAIEKYGWTARQESNSDGWSWGRICEETVTRVNSFYEESHRIQGRMLQVWNQGFRLFQKILPQLPPGVITRPPFLIHNPAEAMMIASWIRSNLDDFDVNEMRKYIHEVIIDRMAKYQCLRSHDAVEDIDLIDNEYEAQSKLDKAISDNAHLLRPIDIMPLQYKILKEHGLESICPTTVYRWLKHLGFTHKKFEKTFRTDGHEKEDNIKDRISHVRRYLELEKFCYRWIQVPRKRIMELIAHFD